MAESGKTILSVSSDGLATLTVSKSVDFDERIRSSADDRSACHGRRKCSSLVSPSPSPAEQVSDFGGNWTTARTVRFVSGKEQFAHSSISNKAFPTSAMWPLGESKTPCL